LHSISPQHFLLNSYLFISIPLIPPETLFLITDRLRAQTKARAVRHFLINQRRRDRRDTDSSGGGGILQVKSSA
jgi:hypothetical protein